MITLRYHFLTIMAIFLSLGLGIILGGSMGQNWINQKQQAILTSLEKKYDQALKSNQSLQHQIVLLSTKMEQTNKEFSRFVSSDYIADLQGKNIGLWAKPNTELASFKQFLSSVGLHVIMIGESVPQNPVSFPVLFIGEELPDWWNALDKKDKLHIQHPSSSPSEQWEMLKTIQKLYKENKYEY